VDIIWAKVLDLIRMDIKQSSFDRWFSSILSVSRKGNAILIAVPDEYAQSYMEQAFSQMIRNSLRLVANEDLDVCFVNASEESSFVDEPELQKISFAATQESEGSKQQAGFRFNPRYTFDSFVVGSSNRFAHAAAMAVAERPSRTYNPLFIYGGSGLGKTHLMHAIGHNILGKKASAKVVYISTESFTNEFISMVRMGKVHTFKNRYRTADIFLIDDIQFLTGKEGTQEEFFHTFNALHEAGKQIVISSDRHPKEIETLEERLRSRFEWGLITDIQPPDVETRCAILQRKAFLENIVVPDDVIFFIADNIHSNIRELEGALNKVILFATLNHLETITLDNAYEALKDLIATNKKSPPSIATIQIAVAEYYQLREEDLKSQKRDRSISFPRQVAMYLCRELLSTSLPRIGQEFGGRDHTTVIHACEKINNCRKEDKQLEKALNYLTEKVQG